MATALLLMGSIFGLLGFFFAAVSGVMKYFEQEDKFPSHNGYFPPTVSEMVHDPEDPAGKVFFAFEFVAASFIFLSWYPWELKNVYLGDDDFAICDISWVMLRQFIPAPGMMLVATVTTTPLFQATLRDWVTISIHLLGAMMCFVGYVIIEGKTLSWACFKKPTHSAQIRPREHAWRVFFLNNICFWYCFFLAVQIVLGLPHMPICCADVHGVPPGSPSGTKPELTNTASGFVLCIKVISYLSEVLCGVSLIASHMTIWYYSSERHIDLEDEIVEMGTQGYQRLHSGDGRD